MTQIFELFQYEFFLRAFIVGNMVALCASLLGVSLVLKRYSMIGDGLSHVGFGAFAVATAAKLPALPVAMPIVIVAAFLLLRVSKNSKINGDAAIALISVSALAIGVIVISKSTGLNTDVCNYMFGSILAMTTSDLFLSIALSLVVAGLFLLFYHKMFAVTFDETFAQATGTNAAAYNMLLAALTAVTVVLGMRLMGAMLISSLVVFPALTAMRLRKSFRGVIITSVVISVAGFTIGLICSALLNIPTGASVVVVNLIAFAAASLIQRREARTA